MVDHNEVGFLFSDAMVCAERNGLKTQTRRIVPTPRCATLHGRRPLPFRSYENCGLNGLTPYLSFAYTGGDLGDEVLWTRVHPRASIGDRIYVKECWAVDTIGEDDEGAAVFLLWRATDPDMGKAPEHVAAIPKDKSAWVQRELDRHRHGIPVWRPSIYLPKWAARTWLEVTDVRVQRVQEISDADALAEGALAADPNAALMRPDELKPGDAAYLFRTLWDLINGERCPWTENPWVFAYTFRRFERRAEA